MLTVLEAQALLGDFLHVAFYVTGLGGRRKVAGSPIALLTHHPGPIHASYLRRNRWP